MTNHPHQAFIDELKIAVKELVPTTPAELIQEAKEILSNLEKNPSVTSENIHKAMTEIGQKEYPYRKAYHDMCDGDAETRLKKLIYERIDEEVKRKIEETVQYVLLEDFVKSELFEEMLSADERYQITNAILLAKEDLEHQCTDECTHKQEEYDALIEKREEEVRVWQKMIDDIRLLGIASPEHASDIHAACDRLEEGWSITQRDPSKEEIEKEMEYWKEVTSQEGDEE